MLNDREGLCDLVQGVPSITYKERDSLASSIIVNEVGDRKTTEKTSSTVSTVNRVRTKPKLGSLRSYWPENAIGVKESTKIIISEDGEPLQLITRVYKMKDGSEKKIVSTEAM